MKVINCVDLFNKQIDEAYEHKIKEVTSELQLQKLDEFILMFELQKAVKITLYEAMDQLRDKKHEPTKHIIDTHLKELHNKTYINWK